MAAHGVRSWVPVYGRPDGSCRGSCHATCLACSGYCRPKRSTSRAPTASTASSWPTCSGFASSTKPSTANFSEALEVLARSHDTQKKSVTPQLHRRRPTQGAALATSSRTRCGGPAIASWPARTASRSCKAGPSSRIPATRTGRTCAGTRSGQPISFQMDLYQPLYVSGRCVEPELFGNIRPVVHGGSLNPDVRFIGSWTPIGLLDGRVASAGEKLLRQQLCGCRPRCHCRRVLCRFRVRRTWRQPRAGS